MGLVQLLGDAFVIADVLYTLEEAAHHWFLTEMMKKKILEARLKEIEQEKAAIEKRIKELQ
ncbi:MAG: hypothetical protein QXM75_04620 [Candidatus Diapherotrites archaeon]